MMKFLYLETVDNGIFTETGLLFHNKSSRLFMITDTLPQESIAALCHKWKVRELALQTPVFVLALLTLIILAAACAKKPSNWWTDAELLKFMKDSSKIDIVFRTEYSANKVHHPAETLEITGKDAIHSLVSPIALVPKKPCNCAHDQGLVFWKDDIPLHVSICNHCFDIRVGKRIRNYEMPPVWYKTFQELAAKHNKKTNLDL
jgi:hypothetical protein